MNSININDMATSEYKKYSYASEQDYITVTNTGTSDLMFDVGKYTNIVLHPSQTWANEVDFKEFQIKSLGSPCIFTAELREYGNDYVTSAQLADITQQTIMKEKRQNLRSAIQFPAAKGLISLRFDDNDQTVYTNAFPLLRNRAFPFTLALSANMCGIENTRPKLTMAQIQEMVKWGAEIASHSWTHTDTPITIEEINHEIIESKTYWETNANVNVKDFVLPGNWKTRPTADSDLGKLIMKHYLYYEGYEGYYFNPRPADREFGLQNLFIDPMALEDVKKYIDIIANTTGQAMTMLWHYVGYPGLGMSTADFTTLLDYIKAKRDAGLIEVVTDSGLLAAGLGEPKNLAMNPSFEILEDINNPYPFNQWPNLYTKVGSPTIETDTPHTGTHFVRCNESNYIIYKHKRNHYDDINHDSPIYRFRVWHRSTGGGTARVSIINTTQNFTGVTVSAPSTSTWQLIEICATMRTDCDYLNFALIPVGSIMVDYDDISIERIG